MPAIQIPEVLFERLQKLAVPLVDTPAIVLERLITVYEVHMGAASQTSGRPDPAEKYHAKSTAEIEPATAPSLRHTRVIAAEFAGRKADAWNNLVQVAHIEAVHRLGSVEAVRRVTTSKMIPGRANREHEKQGYRYVAEINACIQNVDAEHAWSNTYHMAKALKVPVEVDIQWSQKRDAARPGQTARLLWKPKDQNSS